MILFSDSGEISEEKHIWSKLKKFISLKEIVSKQRMP